MQKKIIMHKHNIYDTSVSDDKPKSQNTCNFLKSESSSMNCYVYIIQKLIIYNT